jgi:hypothetical protein
MPASPLSREFARTVATALKRLPKAAAGAFQSQGIKPPPFSRLSPIQSMKSDVAPPQPAMCLQ